MRYFIVFVSVMYLFSACSLFQDTSHKKHYYQIYYNPDDSFPARDSVVRIKTFYIDQVYKRYNLVYRDSKYEMFYYNYHFWATRPAYIVTDVILRHVKSSGMFKEVLLELEKKPDYVITGRIVALDRINSGERWFARASMEFVIKDFHTDEVLASHYFERRKEVFNRDPVYIVRALSSLIEQETSEFLKKVDEKI